MTSSERVLAGSRHYSSDTDSKTKTGGLFVTKGLHTPKVVDRHMLVNAIRSDACRENTFGSIVDKYVNTICLRLDFLRSLRNSFPIGEIARSKPVHP